MALFLTIVTIVVAVGISTVFWSVVGPKVLVPHDGTSRYTPESWAKIRRALILIMAVMTLVYIGIAVAILG